MDLRYHHVPKIYQLCFLYYEVYEQTTARLLKRVSCTLGGSTAASGCLIEDRLEMSGAGCHRRCCVAPELHRRIELCEIALSSQFCIQRVRDQLIILALQKDGCHVGLLHCKEL